MSCDVSKFFTELYLCSVMYHLKSVSSLYIHRNVIKPDTVDNTNVWDFIIVEGHSIEYYCMHPLNLKSGRTLSRLKSYHFSLVFIQVCIRKSKQKENKTIREI